MTTQVYPTGGWKSRTVRVPRPTGEPALLTLRSRGPLTSFLARPVRDTKEELTEGAFLFVTKGTAPHPFVLEGSYTHVRVERTGREGNGFARWQLDRLTPDSLTELRDEHSGEGTQLLRWDGSEADFRFAFSGGDSARGSCFQFFTARDGTEEPVGTTGTTRGTFSLPGPGYLLVISASRWEITSP